MKDKSRPRSPVSVARIVILAGLAAGLAMLIGWRYIAVKQVVIPDEAGKIFVFSYLDYRSGPPWWPAIVLYPLIGLGIGVLLAALVATVLMVRPLSRRAVTTAAWITIVAAGALTGFVSAHLMTTSPPVIEAVAVDTDTPPPGSLDPSWPGVYNAPPTFDLLPHTATLIALGTGAAAIAAATQLAARHRTKTSQ